MRRSTGWLILTAAALLAVVLAIVFGVIPPRTSPDVARPPCDQLPRRTDVAQALDSHRGLVAQLEAIGEKVHVTNEAPCGGQPDKALVMISYHSEDERQSIDRILTTQNGFGVPAQLKRTG